MDRKQRAREHQLQKGKGLIFLTIQDLVRSLDFILSTKGIYLKDIKQKLTRYDVIFLKDYSGCSVDKINTEEE